MDISRTKNHSIGLGLEEVWKTMVLALALMPGLVINDCLQ